MLSASSLQLTAVISTGADLFNIVNSGSEITSTDYWETEHAKAGLCYLSGNAHALRLLVPEAAEGLLAEMKTGQEVTIERSIAEPQRCVDIVFEDGTSSPFALSLDKLQIDRTLTAGTSVPFSVWTERGKQISLLAALKV